MADYTFISSSSLPHLNFPSYAADDYDVMPITITVESDISTDIEDPPVSPVSPTQPSSKQSLDPGLLSPPSTSRTSRSPASGKSSHRKRSSSVPPDPRTGAGGYNDNRRLVSPSTPNLLVGQQPLQIDIALPPPPLFRPKTFWRNTRRSAVTGPSYSPSSYLVRRSTFIAAGLSLDKPRSDLSAFGVESRVSGVVLVPDTVQVLQV